MDLTTWFKMADEISRCYFRYLFTLDIMRYLCREYWCFSTLHSSDDLGPLFLTCFISHRWLMTSLAVFGIWLIIHVLISTMVGMGIWLLAHALIPTTFGIRECMSNYMILCNVITCPCPKFYVDWEICWWKRPQFDRWNGVLYQKQMSRTGTSNYILLWGCEWYR